MTMTIGDMVEKALERKGITLENGEDEFIQGDIWIANLEKKAMGHEQGGRRPVVIISKTKWNKSSKTPICVILSTSKKKSKNRYTVQLKRNREESSSANASQVYTLDAKRLLRKVDSISKSELRQIKKILSELTWVE
jgi:mRNA-degrading endonuclease toxin of MazEF toxin-antitoxin module